MINKMNEIKEQQMMKEAKKREAEIRKKMKEEGQVVKPVRKPKTENKESAP
jgi:hypothetical protein